jgi:hypothetical protein
VYACRAAVTRVVDGNTIYVDVDMGFDLRQKMKLRLAGLPAKDFVEAALPVGSAVVVKTHKLGKFGCFIADGFSFRAKVIPKKSLQVVCI